MSNQLKNNKPTFKGLTWYREQYFSFYIPIDWHKYEWQDGRQGILFGPTPDDLHTVFAVEVRDLGMRVETSDINDLALGFRSGIEHLPGIEIESQTESVKGNLPALSAKYTYLEDGVRRKRWVRVFYHDTRQVAVTVQGATVEDYEYWLPMFFEAMMTVTVHKTKPGPQKPTE